MHALMEELLDNPNVYEESDFQDYFELNRAGDPTYGTGLEEIKNADYTLSYAGEMLIGIDIESHNILTRGNLKCGLHTLLDSSEYDTKEKFKEILEDFVSVLTQDYVAVDSSYVISSYDPISDQLYHLDLGEDVFDLSVVEPNEYNHTLLKNPMGSYGHDLGELKVVFENKLGNWYMRMYVLEGGALKVASCIREGSISIVNPNFIPLVCDSHWDECIRSLDAGQMEIVHTSDGSMPDILSSVL